MHTGNTVFARFPFPRRAMMVERLWNVGLACSVGQNRKNQCLPMRYPRYLHVSPSHK